MATNIVLKRSATADAVPSTGDLELGELALNTYDGKLYMKKTVSGSSSIVNLTGGTAATSSAFAHTAYKYTASSNQTTFTGSDANSVTLAYNAGAIQVFLNGILLDAADYTASNGTSVVLGSGAGSGDILLVTSFEGTNPFDYFKYTATNGQTSFSGNDANSESLLYTVGNIQVYLNGVLLDATDYTATSGTTVVLGSGATTGDILTIWEFNETGLTDLTNDTTPQLAGNLDVQTYDIVSTSNRDIDIVPNGTGNVTLQTDTLQLGSSGENVTVTTNGTGDVTLNTNSGSNSGSIVIADGANANITVTPNGSGIISLAGDTTIADGSNDFDIASHDGTNGLKLGGTVVTTTAAELNTVDGSTAASSTTLAAADRLIVNDDGTMKQVALSDFETFFELALDTIANLEVTTELQTPLIAFTDGDDAIQIADGGGVTMAAGLTSTAAANTFGTTSFGDADITNVGDIQLDSITGDGDTNTSITFSGSDVITIAAGGDNQVTFTNGAIVPSSDNDIDLGTSGTEFKDAFFDGTVTSDAFAGPLTGDVTGNVSGTAATVTTAAQPAITSLGTLTALTVDNLGINGNTITANSGALNLTPASGSAIVLDSTINVDAGVVTGATSITSTAFVGAVTGNADTATLATLATTITASANNSADETVYPTFVDGATGTQGLETDTGLTYNPSSGDLTTAGQLGGATLSLSGNATVGGNLTVTGTTTQVNTVTMNAQNAVVFEGATADNYETTLSIVDPTADHTQYLINQGGYIPVLAAATTTAISATPAELNLLDGSTANSVVNSKAVVYGSSGELAGTLSTAAQTSVTSLGTLTTLTVDDMTLNGSTISDASDLTLDLGGDLIIDVDGDNVWFDAAGTRFLSISQVSSDVYIGSEVADKDIFFRGKDASSTITALTLDMSQAGAATFNAGASFNGQVQLYDNDKLILGDGDDLQIYHDASNSYIKDTGTGSLVIASGGLFLQNAAADENMIRAVENGAVTLYYDNSAKLDTVTGGIDVTGTVVCDGGNYDGANTFNDTGADVDFRVESSGNANMLFVDGGNNAVGIGTGSPGAPLHISAAADGAKIKLTRGGVSEHTISIGNSPVLTGVGAGGLEIISLNAGAAADFAVGKTGGNEPLLHLVNTGYAHFLGAADLRVTFGTQGTAGNNDSNWIRGNAATLSYNTASGDHFWEVGGTEKMRLKSTGLLGIGTSSPSAKLTVNGTSSAVAGANDPGLTITGGTASQSYGKINMSGAGTGVDAIRISNDGGHTICGTEKSDGGGLAGSTLAYSSVFGSIGATATHLMTNNAAKMTVESGGNVGIGTTGPTAKLHLYTSGAEGINLGIQNSERYYNIETDGGNLMFKDVSAGGTARMTILSDGKVGIGITAPGTLLDVDGTSQFRNTLHMTGNPYLQWTGGVYFSLRGANSNNDMSWTSTPSGGGERWYLTSGGRTSYDSSSTKSGHGNFVGEVGSSMKAIMFEHTNGGGEVGKIITTSSTATLSNTSDYRLKENVSYTWDATTRLKQLKPIRFNWIRDETPTLVDGFLAHEVADVMPEIVHGEKDAMTDPILYECNEDELPEGKAIGDVKVPSRIDPQGLSHSSLVPLLVKTIQELEERLKTTEAKIAVLEG